MGGFFVSLFISLCHTSHMSTIPSKAFCEGFVKACTDKGLTVSETEAAWHTHNFNAFLATPGIYNSFREKLASYAGGITKARILPYLTPEALAISAECHVKYASDRLSKQVRTELGLPEPSWDTVPETTRKIASQMNDMVASYANLPLHQKILIASLAGAGIGGAARTLRPSVDDQVEGRGKLNRFAHGAARGGFTGAGAAAGSEAGGALGLNGLGEKGIMPGMAVGGLAGGLAGNRLFA